MKGSSIRAVAGLIAAGALAFDAAQAATIWSLGTSGSPGTDTGLAIGNVRTFAEGGGSVAVSAWSNTGSPAGSYAAGYLGRYATGLGVCNTAEVGVAGSLAACASDGGVRDQVDNVGNHDVVLFVFDTPQVFDSLTIDPYGVFDRDVSYWIGTVAGGFTLAGLTLADLPGAGFGPQSDSFNGIGTEPVTIALGGIAGNAILVGALTPPDSDPDKFKVAAIGTSPVPLPATAWLFAVGIGVAAARMRRR